MSGVAVSAGASRSLAALSVRYSFKTTAHGYSELAYRSLGCAALTWQEPPGVRWLTSTPTPTWANAYECQ